MLKRIDHIGVIVDDLEEAQAFLGGMGMEFDRDLQFPGRLKAAFYRCGDTQIEVIEITDAGERESRLRGEKARIEHIAIEVDELASTMKALEGLGVRTKSPEPLKIGNNLNIWTTEESGDGVSYQLIEKG